MNFINILFFFILSLILIKLISNSYEAFSINYKDELDKTPFFDTNTGVMMAGSEFISSQINPNKSQDAYSGSFETNEFLDDGSNGNMGLNFNNFSKECCAPQYPLSFEMENKGILNSDETYVMSPYTGNNSWSSAGCICMTKEQRDFLNNRGGNA